jgi:hypothetical protein
MSSSNPTSSVAAAAHASSRELVDAADVLETLQPFFWQGLVFDFDTSDLANEIRQYAPGLAISLQIAGRLGRPVAPVVLVERTGALPTQYRINPYLVVWPCTSPRLNGSSLLDRPTFTARPGDSLFLRVQWQFSAGFRLNSSNAVLVISSGELENGNDYSALPDPPNGSQRIWHHHIGLFNAAGEFLPSELGTIPFIPPQL